MGYIIVGSIALVWFGCGALGAGWWYGTCIKKWKPLDRLEYAMTLMTILFGPITLLSTSMTIWDKRPWTWSLRMVDRNWYALHELLNIKVFDE